MTKPMPANGPDRVGQYLATRYWLTPKGWRALGVTPPTPDPAPRVTLGEYWRRTGQNGHV